MTDAPTDRAVDDPVEVARSIATLARPVLLAFDCDGVLAPLTDHADDSVLTPGVQDALAQLAVRDDMTVAVLSGRSLEGLAQFGFDESIEVWGSYGAERRGHAPVELTPVEADRLGLLDDVLSEAAARAGRGAWVERKPTSSVLHVRQADRERGREALEWALRRQAELDGHTCHEGSDVLELMTRSADKGTALAALRGDLDPASCMYIGDDIPDEQAFARLGHGDVTIKVGPAETVATRRLAGTEAVRTMLDELVAATSAP